MRTDRIWNSTNWRDEGEREDLASRDPQRAKELAERLLAWRRSLPVLPA